MSDLHDIDELLLVFDILVILRRLERDEDGILEEVTPVVLQ